MIPELSSEPVINEPDLQSVAMEEDNDAMPVTNLSMLFEKINTSNDIEFAESCSHIGLLHSDGLACTSCTKPMKIVSSVVEDSGAIWSCQACNIILPLRTKSWSNCLNKIPLKRLVLLIYCWSRGYAIDVAHHETGCDIELCRHAYDKLSELPGLYFEDAISDIGGMERRICVDVICIEDVDDGGDNEGKDCLLGGMDIDQPANTFFVFISRNPTRDELVSGLIDHINGESVIEVNRSSNIFTILGEAGIAYIRDEWKIAVKESTTENDSLKNLHSDYLNSKASSDTKSLKEFLFRKRMQSHEDPFLFIMAVIASLSKRGVGDGT